MANFGCLPQEILENIFQFLPVRDWINSGFVCANWNDFVGCNLKHVKIDASLPFGGKWEEENWRWFKKKSTDIREWIRDENDPADKEIEN